MEYINMLSFDPLEYIVPSSSGIALLVPEIDVDFRTTALPSAQELHTSNNHLILRIVPLNFPSTINLLTNNGMFT